MKKKSWYGAALAFLMLLSPCSLLYHEIATLPDGGLVGPGWLRSAAEVKAAQIFSSNNPHVQALCRYLLQAAMSQFYRQRV